MPEYFCFEVIETLKRQTNIEIAYYLDYPSFDESYTINSIPFHEGDVLFRVNYYGIRTFRCEKSIPVPVIEDHTHDLLGRWALFSDADWCIASLRKTLPIAEGGMLWSPKGHQLTIHISLTLENHDVASERWRAMKLKNDFLLGKGIEKDSFRKLFIKTEEWFDQAEISLIDEESMDFISKLDINAWQNTKKRNINLLKELLSVPYTVVTKEDETCNMFSLVLLTKNREERDLLRKNLIDRRVYPAILWNIPEDKSYQAKEFSERMLSIHCDGRYSENDIRQLATIINKTIIS